MRPGHALLPILLLSGLSFPLATSHAAKPSPIVEPLFGAPRPLAVGAPSKAVPGCALGVTGAPASITYYLIPPDDAYYTLIDPTECACGTPSGVRLSTAHVQLEMPTAYCTLPVSVALLEADQSDPSCPQPRLGEYVCAPVEYDLSVSEPGVYDISFPLAAGCTITEKSFLVITFLTTGDCFSEFPGFVLTGSCEPCLTLNTYPGHADDLCDVGFTGNPIIYVESVCNAVVPAEPGSWGRLKTLYR